uniref:acid phosphatase n=1 Tax=Homalodisca liturata TaxID=320908 RepID=A0A1B6JV14_9HEMI
MKLVRIFILSVCVCCSHSTLEVKVGSRAVSTLKFLVVVSKHGARAPTHTYPRDPYRNITFWPEGAGQLTKVGKRQMYRVGQKLRHLYHGYLSALYENSKVMIQSTLVDRTMASAATLLAGLYPPQAHQLWNPEIPWQPVPIYPNLLDKALLTLDPTKCPRYWHEQNISQSILQDQYTANHYADIYAAITAGSGVNMSFPSQMFLLFHNLAASTENGLTLPNWAEDIFLPKMLPLVSKMVRDTTMKNVKMIKILNGLFFGKIVEMLQRRLKQQSDKQEGDLNMLLHVGHDITILCLLAAVGLHDSNIPWSSTTLLFELHTNEALQSKHEVKVLKIDGLSNSSNIPEDLEIPFCKSPCDLSTFLSHTEKYTTKDWGRECMDMNSPSDQ